jgi:YhcH/YjgK/YiaL family protein
MIQDRLDNAARYHGLHPRFARAFAWCADPDNRRRANGRHDIEGDDLYAIVDSGTTGAPGDKRFESHRRYIDIQINLEGGEVMEWTPTRGLTVADDFQPGGDLRFYHAPSRGITRLLVSPEEFAIFWPEDAHKPCCHPASAPVAYRKIVVKVAV